MTYKDFSSDDLGTHWYLFYGHSIARCINWLAQFKNGYEIVEVKVWKKYWLFGELRVSILMENERKIKKLENSQHYSKLHEDHPSSFLQHENFIH